MRKRRVGVTTDAGCRLSQVWDDFEGKSNWPPVNQSTRDKEGSILAKAGRFRGGVASGIRHSASGGVTSLLL